jgi:hypothetical protein
MQPHIHTQTLRVKKEKEKTVPVGIRSVYLYVGKCIFMCIYVYSRISQVYRLEKRNEERQDRICVKDLMGTT